MGKGDLSYRREIEDAARLLNSEDSGARSRAREGLVEAGPGAAAVLRQYATSASPRDRARIWAVLHEIGSAAFLTQLEQFAEDPQSVQLERAALAVSGLENPVLDADLYVSKLAEYSKDLQLMLGPPEESQYNLEAFTTYMSGELGFSGKAQDYYGPENSFLDQAIDRRTGLPITISLIHMAVGRGAGLPVDGVGLPGHFIISFGDPADLILLDPFNGGALLSVDDCRQLVTRGGLPFRDDFLRPVTPVEIVRRMCRNLVNAYALQRDTARANRYAAIENMLSRS